MDKIKWVANRMPKTADASLPVMSLENVKKARAFHKSFPQYAETPLAKLDGMAKYLGLGKLFVKDESYRFGLNAFKVLGGSFAMANYIAEAVARTSPSATTPTSRATSCARSSARRRSSRPRTATTAAAWPGRRTSWARRLSSSCRRAAARPASTTSRKRARPSPSRT